MEEAEKQEKMAQMLHKTYIDQIEREKLKLIQGEKEDAKH